MVDALRRCLAEEAGDTGQSRHRDPGLARGDETPAVAESALAQYDPRAVGLGPYRLGQLESDLRLSVEKRVAESELAARVTELRTTPTRSQRLLTFDRYEDFLEWERWEELPR